MPYVFSPLKELENKIRSGRLLPAELISQHCERIKKLNHSLNALRIVATEEAKKEALVLDQEAKQGYFRGLLHGITFSAKDHIEVKCLGRSEGNRITEIKKASRDAAVIKLLKKEGAVCIGKGNMAEYGKSYQTDNRDFGRTNNPFNPDYTPGGSGGGDAAAVAAGFASFAVGADAGGSIRIPANFCGLFGLYPTPGTITSHGISAYPHSIYAGMLSIGVLAGALDDLEILARILIRYDPRDPRSVYSSASMLRPASTGKIAYFSELNGVKCDPLILKHIKEAAKKFEAAGFTLVEKIPAHFEQALYPFIILAGPAALLIDDLLAARAGTPRDISKESDAMKTLRSRVKAELPPLTAEHVLDAWHARDWLRIQAAQFFVEYDFILSPVTATLPVKHGTSTFHINGQDYASEQVFQFASAVNLLGLPAVAFPTGISKSGLPVGLQLIGPRFSEFLIIEALRKAGFRERVKLKN
ncbi:MAG: amidase [Candidatus Dadabacteria bacterium]|nr:MAG: amidase [Candidatus Dadabacteria bacterium]